MSGDAFDRFGDNANSATSDPNTVDQAAEQPSRPVITGTSFLAEALDSAGLLGTSPAYGGTADVYQYNKPHYHWSTPDLMGFDPTSGQVTPDLGDDKVYMGTHHAEDAGLPQPHIGNPRLSEEEGGPVSGYVPDTTTVGAAMNQPYLWSDKHVSDVMKKMRESGLKVETFDDLMGAWQMMVTRASRAFTLSHGKREVTPWDILSSVKKENLDSGVLDKNGNVVQTSVQKSVNDISDADAWATLRTTMTAMLGRKPTDQEVRDFASRANAMAANNPSVTTTTSTTDPQSGHTTTDSQTKGGFTSNDAQQMAVDNLENTDEFAQVQSATTYMNALLGAMGETGGGMA